MLLIFVSLFLFVCDASIFQSIAYSYVECIVALWYGEVYVFGGGRGSGGSLQRSIRMIPRDRLPLQLCQIIWETCHWNSVMDFVWGRQIDFSIRTELHRYLVSPFLYHQIPGHQSSTHHPHQARCKRRPFRFGP